VVGLMASGLYCIAAGQESTCPASTRIDRIAIANIPCARIRAADDDKGFEDISPGIHRRWRTLRV